MFMGESVSRSFKDELQKKQLMWRRAENVSRAERLQQSFSPARSLLQTFTDARRSFCRTFTSSLTEVTTRAAAESV